MTSRAPILVLTAFAGLVCGLAAGPAFGATAPPPPDSRSTSSRLDTIRRYLELGNPNQRAAAIRQLHDEIGPDDLDELRAYLLRPLTIQSLRPLTSRLQELLTLRLDAVESRIQAFEAARRLARELTGDVAEAKAKDPDLEKRLEEVRANREEERKKIHERYADLVRQGIALAPALWERLQVPAPSPAVERFRKHLHADLLAAARRTFPTAPAKGGISPFERRSLVPLVEELRNSDTEGWDRFRSEIASEMLGELSTLRPAAITEARTLFLELGKWGEGRLKAWAKESDGPPTPRLRRLFETWNRLAVPVGFEERTGLPLGDYDHLTPEKKVELLYRLEWVGGQNAVPVIARILTTEDDLSLQVEAAKSLAHLSDPRGVEFLRQIGLASAMELQNISRELLLMEAIRRRDAGDLQGAIDEFQDMLRRLPGDQRVHYELAWTALRAKRYELAIQHFKRALTFDPRDKLTHYNLACALALAGRPDEALKELKSAVDCGFTDKAHLAEDPDLETLHDLPGYKKLIESMKHD